MTRDCNRAHDIAKTEAINSAEGLLSNSAEAEAYNGA